MSDQLLNPEPQEMAAELKEVLDANENEGFVFDLDDTIIPTHKNFVKHVEEFKATASKDFGIDSVEFSTIFLEINTDIVLSNGVNPNVWDLILRGVGERYGDSQMFLPYLPSLMAIYNVVPEIHEGAVELLAMLKSIDRRLGLNTHANVPWTHFKLEKTDLAKYFDYIHIADENKQKSHMDWLATANGIGVPESRVIPIGDNVKGDIQAARKAGFYPRGVLLPSPWHLYASGEIPEGTIYVPGGIKDVARALIDNLK